MQARHGADFGRVAQHALDARPLRGRGGPTGRRTVQLDVQQHPERVTGAELSR